MDQQSQTNRKLQRHYLHVLPTFMSYIHCLAIINLYCIASTSVGVLHKYIKELSAFYLNRNCSTICAHIIKISSDTIVSLSIIPVVSRHLKISFRNDICFCQFHRGCACNVEDFLDNNIGKCDNIAYTTDRNSTLIIITSSTSEPVTSPPDLLVTVYFTVGRPE